MMTEFKLKGVGLDTTCLNYEPRFIRVYSNPFNYVYTNPSSNNGDLVGRIKKEIQDESTKLIVGLDFLDESLEVIREHLRELKKEQADLLLIDASCEWVEYDDNIQELLDYELVKEIGIKNPEKLTIEQLEGLRVRYGFRYVGMDICPIYYNVEIMNWIKTNGLQLIGFNQLGGYFSSTVAIECLTLPYLLNFAAFYCDFVMLSGRDITFSEVNKEFLEGLIGQSTDDSVYIVKKSVNKLVKPLKRIANLSLKINEELFPINEQDELFNNSEFVINFGDAKKEIDLDADLGDDPVINRVIGFLEEAKIPKDANTPKDFMAFIRPKVYDLIKKEYNEDSGWYTMFSFLGDIYMFSAFKIIETKKFLRRTRRDLETNNYFLFYSKDTGFIFRKLKKNEEIA